MGFGGWGTRDEGRSVWNENPNFKFPNMRPLRGRENSCWFLSYIYGIPPGSNRAIIYIVNFFAVMMPEASHICSSTASHEKPDPGGVEYL